MTEKEYLSQILVLLECLFHELKENCPGCYDLHKMSCFLCEYKHLCQLECDSDETVQD